MSTNTYQLRSVLEEQIGDVGMTILAGIGQSGVSGPRLGVDGGSTLQEVLGQLQVSLLSSLHQGSRGSQLQVGSGLDQEVGDLQEAATTGKGQSRFLGLLRLRVDVGT